MLGIPAVAKPEHLAKRGGCWFERGPLKVHLGVEDDFVPTTHKAHPAFIVDGLRNWQQLVKAPATTSGEINHSKVMSAYMSMTPLATGSSLMEPR